MEWKQKSNVSINTDKTVTTHLPYGTPRAQAHDDDPAAEVKVSTEGGEAGTGATVVASSSTPSPPVPGPSEMSQ